MGRETVVVSQEGAVKRGETLAYPGLKAHETAALPRRSPEMPAYHLASRPAQDSDAGASHRMGSPRRCVQS